MVDKLEELKKKIYSPGGLIERKKKEFFEVPRKKEPSPKIYWDIGAEGPVKEKPRNETDFSASSSWRDYKIKGGVAEKAAAEGQGSSEPFYKSKLFIFTALAFLAVALASAVFIYYSFFFQGGALALEILGESSAEAGDTKTWTVIIRNESRILTKNAELTFIYPRGTDPLDDGFVLNNLRSKRRFEEIPPGEEIRLDFSARIFGNIGEEKKAEAIFLYQPENVSTRLVKNASFITSISQVPLVISYDLPENVISGQDVKIMLDFTSNAKSVFKDLYLRIDFPPGFELLSSDLKPDYEKNIWNLGDLNEGESRRLTLNGKVIGFSEEIKSFVASLGEYNVKTRQWKIYFEKAGDLRVASSPLFVRQEVNRSPNYIGRFGETLGFTVYYKNNLTVPVKDVFIKTRLSEDLLDLKNLRIEKGFFDGSTREIVWSGSSDQNLKELGPGNGGSVSFSVIVKKQPVITGFSDKNFVVTSLAKIGAKTVPAGFEGAKLEYEDLLEMKLQSHISLLAKAIFYNSPLGSNIGTLPPKLNKETGYTVIFQISNLSNDTRGVKVFAFLPGNVKWLDQVTGDKKDRLNFNPSSGEIVWEAGEVAAGTGVIRPRLFLAFNVAITPGEDVLNKRALLVKDIRIVGQDAFTKIDLEEFVSEVTTELKEDPNTTNGDWSVTE